MRSGTVETEGTIDHMSWLGLCSDQLERERGIISIRAIAKMDACSRASCSGRTSFVVIIPCMAVHVYMRILSCVC